MLLNSCMILSCHYLLFVVFGTFGGKVVYLDPAKKLYQGADTEILLPCRLRRKGVSSSGKNSRTISVVSEKNGVM